MQIPSDINARFKQRACSYTKATTNNLSLKLFNNYGQIGK
jgi:hypothetical protein